MVRKDPKADKEYHRGYYQRNKAKISAKRKIRHAANPNKQREQSRKYYAENKSKAQEYYDKNRDKIRAYNREYGRRRRARLKLDKMCKDIADGKGIDDKTSWCKTWVDATLSWFKRMGKGDDR